MALELVPMTLRRANDFIAEYHRHNKRTSRDGGKFAIGAGTEADGLVGVAIVGNPLSATFMDGYTAEVLRTCSKPGSPKNVNSFLYGACWRAWRAMGGRKLITYTLQTESGVSLRAAGWQIIGQTKPVPAGWGKKDHLVREWQPIYGQQKFRWEISA
jgi:hypothetical protein